MPSNERNINGNEESENYGIDAVTEMSAEEIERLLAESAGTRYGEQPAEEEFQGDVLNMLEETGNHDEDLSDIQDMLKKSDRNERIDAGDLEEADVSENPVDKLLADIEGAAGEPEKPLSAKEQKALEKQRKAQEKTRLAQEKAERAAKKKADKEASRAEKKAAKARKRGKKSDAQEPEEPEKSRIEESGEIEEFDLLQDKELLDSIVSDAGKLGGEKRDDSREKTGFSVNQLGEEFDAAKEREKTLEAERMKERSVKPEKETAGESDILELDMDEIDAFIPDISSEPKEGAKKQKGGLMTKIITMLTEEEPENEDIPISEENQEIIRDLDQEKGSGGKGKKAKKAKKPAKKKEKKKKAPKPAKPPKPKKPKKEKEPEPYAGKKITFKKALPILLLGATVGAVVFIFVNLSVDFSVKQAAAEAYQNGDYETCYQNLYGKKLSDEQAQMYGKSECILFMEQEYRKYDIVLQHGTEVQALDSLLQTVNNYPPIRDYAAQCDALPEVEEIYAGIMGILSDKYGITEEQAREIASMGSRIEYTRAVTAVAEGKGYGTGNASGASTQPEGNPEEIQGAPEVQPEEGNEALPDELPEEAELEEGNFVDG